MRGKGQRMQQGYRHAEPVAETQRAAAAAPPPVAAAGSAPTQVPAMLRKALAVNAQPAGVIGLAIQPHTPGVSPVKAWRARFLKQSQGLVGSLIKHGDATDGTKTPGRLVAGQAQHAAARPAPPASHHTPAWCTPALAKPSTRLPYIAQQQQHHPQTRGGPGCGGERSASCVVRRRSLSASSAPPGRPAPLVDGRSATPCPRTSSGGKAAAAAAAAGGELAADGAVVGGAPGKGVPRPLLLSSAGMELRREVSGECSCACLSRSRGVAARAAAAPALGLLAGSCMPGAGGATGAVQGGAGSCCGSRGPQKNAPSLAGASSGRRGVAGGGVQWPPRSDGTRPAAAAASAAAVTGRAGRRVASSRSSAPRVGSDQSSCSAGPTARVAGRPPASAALRCRASGCTRCAGCCRERRSRRASSPAPARACSACHCASNLPSARRRRLRWRSQACCRTPR